MIDLYNGYAQSQWNDIRVSLEQTKINPATSKPDYGTFKGNTKAHLFDASTNEGVTFAVQIPHSWKEGTMIYPHVHWSPTTTASGTVIFKLEYTIASVGGTFGDTVTITATDSADEVAYGHQIAAFTGISMTDNLISTMLNCYLYRDAATDTYGADVAVLEFDIHYDQNSLGSSLAYTK